MEKANDTKVTADDIVSHYQRTIVGGIVRQRTVSEEIQGLVSSLSHSILAHLRGGLSDLLAPSVLEFDQEIMGVHLAQFLRSAQQLGGEIAEHATLVQKAFKAQRDFLDVATRHAKPDDNTLQNLLSDTTKAISEIQSYREERQSSPVFNHLSGVSESIPALTWVIVAPTPGRHVKKMNDAGQFYTKRILKNHKQEPGHAEWAKSWVELLVALRAYVKKNHATGLVWGKEPLTEAEPVHAGGAPPPPPPPTYDLDDVQNLNISGGSGDRAALFAALNQGEGVTNGLKKVTADQQTHKNPNLRGGSTVPAKEGSSTAQVSKAPSAVSKPPKFALEGKKWCVEYQIGRRSLTIDKVEMNQVVYMFGCKDSVLNIKGELNSIVIDSCVKTTVAFDSPVSSVEFVNCKDCQMHVMGKVPTIAIDKVDGLQIYLSQDSLGVEIFSSKSSALNVMVPKGSTGEYSETPIPEQFIKTVVTAMGGLVHFPRLLESKDQLVLPAHLSQIDHDV